MTNNLASGEIINHTRDGIIADIAQCKATVTKDIKQSVADAHAEKNRVITRLNRINEQQSENSANVIKSILDNRDNILTELATFQTALTNESTSTINNKMGIAERALKTEMDRYVLQHTITLN